MVPIPGCLADDTVSPRTEGHRQCVHDRSHQHVMHTLCHRMENVKVFPQRTGVYITVIKAYIKEGLDDALWIYFLPIFTFSVIYFDHKEFPYDE